MKRIWVLAGIVITAAAVYGNIRHIDAENGHDVTGNGSSGSPWKTVQKAFGSVTGGDTVLIEPGFYGELLLGRDQGVGSDSAGYVTYLANPATCTPRPGNWFEDTLVPPDPDDPQGKVIFSFIRFLSYSDDMDIDSATGTPVGHYIVVEGLNVVGKNILLTSYVSNVIVRKCNVFGTWGTYSEQISGPGISIYQYWQYGSDYRDILVEGCYVTHGQRGVHLNGRMTNVTIRNCHFRHFCSTGISLGAGDHCSNVLFEGNHAHGQVMVPYGSGTPQTVTAVDGTEPDRVFTVSGPGRTHPFFIALTDASTGSTEVKATESWDSDSLIITLKEPLSFVPEPGDSIRLHDATHGSGIGITGDSAAFRGNRVYDCGGTRPLYIYGGGTRLTIENNLIYSGYSFFTVDFANKLGEGCRIVNNTFAGRRHGNYISNNDGTMAYGLAMIGTGLQSGTDPASIVIANNVFAGKAEAPAGAVVKNNIVFAGDGFEEDAEGDNAGNLVYFAGGAAGTEPHPFETDSGFFAGGAGFDDCFLDVQSNNLNEFFRPVEGSDAIGFADPAYAPATDMTGADRDASPDAGCYEYGSLGIGISDFRFSILDCPALANPAGQKAINDLRLTIEDLRLFKLSGEAVTGAVEPGIYLMTSGAWKGARKITVLK